MNEKYLLWRRKRMKWPRWPCKAVPRHRPRFACNRLPRYVVAATKLESGVKPTPSALFFNHFFFFLLFWKWHRLAPTSSTIAEGDAQITQRHLPRRLLTGHGHQVHGDIWSTLSVLLLAGSRLRKLSLGTWPSGESSSDQTLLHLFLFSLGASELFAPAKFSATELLLAELFAILGPNILSPIGTQWWVVASSINKKLF